MEHTKRNARLLGKSFRLNECNFNVLLSIYSVLERMNYIHLFAE
jgi:hypothetical protein